MEIGVASLDHYSVFETNGALKWTRIIHDYSSGITGSSVYDFEGDGRAEVVQADELNLWVFDGATGAVLLRDEGHGSGTHIEYPLIADVDRGGQVEIILTSNNHRYPDRRTGITVLGDRRKNWVTGRPVWNQHSYHITNVGDDLSIPRQQVPHWLEGNNTFRQGGFGTRGARAAADLRPALVDLCDDTCPGSGRYLFRIENWGSNTAAAGLPWAIYGENGASQRSLITGGYVGSDIPAGYTSGTVEVLLDPAQVAQWDRVVLIANDDGTGQGSENECRTENNRIALPVPCP